MNVNLDALHTLILVHFQELPEGTLAGRIGLKFLLLDWSNFLRNDTRTNTQLVELHLLGVTRRLRGQQVDRQPSLWVSVHYMIVIRRDFFVARAVLQVGLNDALNIFVAEGTVRREKICLQESAVKERHENIIVITLTQGNHLLL